MIISNEHKELFNAHVNLQLVLPYGVMAGGFPSAKDNMKLTKMINGFRMFILP